MLVTCNVFGEVGAAPTTSVYDVDPHDAVEDIMVLIEIESGVPLAAQRLMCDGRLLQPHRSFYAQGIRGESAMVSVTRATTTGSAPTAGTTDNAAHIIEQLFRTPPAAPQLPAVSNPAAADQLIAQLFQSGGAAPTMPPPPAFDPDDPEVQRRVYEEIQKQNLQENLESALEHTPEAFARVVMLYVPCTVNKVPITAFVDSGAQISIMSERMAEKCGIMRLLDKRMGGVVKGVGTCRSLGRIHMTMVTLGGLVLPFSITVLERQDMDFIIGLDQLKRHQMIIDLAVGALRIGDTQVPFLSEGELPEHLRAETNGEGNDDPAAAPAASSSSEPVREPPAVEAPLPVSAPAAAQLQSADHSQEAAVRRLMELTTLPRVACENALAAANGNEEAAASLLFD